MKAAGPRPTLFRYPALGKWETRLCYSVTVITMLYAYYGVYDVSVKFPWKIGDFGVYSRAPIIGERMKDVSNWEWSRWSPFALSYLPIYLGHSLIFNIGSHFLQDRYFVPFYIILAITACAYFFTFSLVGLSLAQGTLVFFTTTHFRNKWTVWLSSLPILYVAMHHSEWLSDDPFMIFTFLSYSLMSYISYNLEFVAGNGRKEDLTILSRYIRMLFYSFYIPYLYTVIVLYPDFERQISERKTRNRDWKGTIFFGIRIAFWWLFVEAMLHFLYFEAILRDLPYAYSLRKDHFVACGMAIGLFFFLKYVVIFGLPSFFARLDNLQPLPGPICIVRVTLYSKVWREFDRGLYLFFKKYIFLPICAPTFSIQRKIVGVLVSYSFVLLWHGFHHHNIVWIGLNIVALFLEKGSQAVYSIPAVRNWREKKIADIWFRRILAVLHIIPFAVGLYSNFYFLGGSEIGATFVQRFLIEETITLRWPFFLIITLGYFNSHTCIEAERRLALRKAAGEEKDK